MRLRALLAGCAVEATGGNLDIHVDAIAYDSRKVVPGSVFVAIRGERTDGSRFVPQAVRNGAVAVVSALPRGGDLPWVQVSDARSALAELSANLHGHPTRKLQLVGVTGTNGKTTTSYLIQSVLGAAGLPAAVFGTIEYLGPGFRIAADRTTPEAPDTDRLFRRVADGGWKHAVMEVSSHAIELRRVECLRFDVGVFTNLSQDHLDFHGDMNHYFRAKRRMFEGFREGPPRLVILNFDDPSFEELRGLGSRCVLSYGLRQGADIHPVRYRSSWGGTDAVFRTPQGEVSFESPLSGRMNLYNMAAAVAVAIGLEISMDSIAGGMARFSGVPGRFERISRGSAFHVIIDYAHTSDALRNVLQAAREITTGRLIVVFGCGGGRDRTKRPKMGHAAGRFSDLAIVTSDNPRSEDPQSIIRDIEEGLAGTGGSYVVSVNRREAIRTAVVLARDGDTVLIAGKGHETCQIIGDRELPFSDRAVVEELIDELNAGRDR